MKSSEFVYVVAELPGNYAYKNQKSKFPRVEMQKPIFCKKAKKLTIEKMHPCVEYNSSVTYRIELKVLGDTQLTTLYTVIPWGLYHGYGHHLRIISNFQGL